jgi:AraC-like DNA-binding protein
MIVRALDARGLDGEGLAREAGIDPGEARAPAARVARESLTRLWKRAVEATGDPCFALEATRYATQTTFHALGYAVLASATLREALERVIRHRRVIGDVVQLRLEDAGDRCRLVFDVSAPPGVPYESVDAIASLFVRLARQLRGRRDLAPLAVRLERPEPTPSAAFRQLFHVPVAFGQSTNAIEFATADLDAPLPAANAELARSNDEIVVAYLARLEGERVAGRVVAALVRALPAGPPSKAAIARQLGMSARNLQRRLDDEGTSYKALLNDARASLARDYVREGRLNVTEIAFMLGFAETSTFSRAFRRWTGQSPRAFARHEDRKREGG